MDLSTGLGICYQQTVDVLKVVAAYFLRNLGAAMVVCTLSLIRSLLPRFWLWLVLKGEFWPSDLYGPGGILVAYSTAVTFVVSMAWIGLFWVVLADYRRNLVQTVIVSSVVDPQSRV